MRKSIKKILAFASAAAMACGALSLAACGKAFSPLTENPGKDDAVVSNGGFVVEKGDYYYFINGVETYDSDNTYGTPVKGALMRVKKTNGAWGEAEMVIPSLMVEGTHESGFFIYGEKIYYATPTNVKGIDGSVQNSRLDFMSANLDGSDPQILVRVDSNSTPYRFIETGEKNTVYLVYCITPTTTNVKTLHSYNTAEDTDIVLAEDLAGDPVFHKTDKGAATIYYTMAVKNDADSDYPDPTADYNQIYRVEADATASPYTYEWDQAWLDENNDGKAPYTNLGELVLDGRGTNWEKTQFNQSATEPESPVGYTYTLRSYENGGLYFLREETETAGGALYYLPEEKLATGWDSVAGNKGLTMVAAPALAKDDGPASASALYYMDSAGGHHYLYVAGNEIIRADVGEDGMPQKKITIAREEDDATPTLKFLDPVEEGDEYGYVYYSLTVDSNDSICRAVYDNKAHVVEQRYYNALENVNFPQKDEYAATRVLDLEHAAGWYPFEIIGSDLFFADADAAAYGSSLNCISCVSLAAENGIMNNAQIKARNEALSALIDEGAKAVSLLNDIKEDQDDEDILSNAVKYYFYTGETKFFNENAEEYKNAVDANEEADGDEEIENPYTQEIIDAFDKIVKGEEVTYNGNKYTMAKRSAFVTKLGVLNETDEEAYNNYWKTSVLSHYTAPEAAEEGGLAGWAIALIVIVCVLAAGGAAIGVALFLSKKNKAQNEPKKPRMQVDTTDDKDIDVYADDTPQADVELEEEPETPAEETPVEEIPEEQAPVEEAPVEEAPVEEAPVEQAPAEEAPVEEAPAEETPVQETPVEEAPAEAVPEGKPDEGNNE